MPEEKDKILKSNQYMKSDKMPDYKIKIRLVTLP